MRPAETIQRWSELTKARAQNWIRAQLDRYRLASDETLQVFCQQFETFRPTWYLCSSGTRTIGYGYTGPTDQVKPAPWTEDYARKVLATQLRGSYREEAQRALGRCGLSLEDFNQNQQWAILSLVHNGGPRTIWTKDNRPATWVQRWQAGEPRERIEEAYYRYNRSAGKVSPGLVRRRFAEMRLFWDGVVDFYPTGWRAYYQAHEGD